MSWVRSPLAAPIPAPIQKILLEPMLWSQSPESVDSTTNMTNLVTSSNPQSIVMPEISFAWFTPFEPPSWLRGGHAQTLAGNFWRRSNSALSAEAQAVEVDPADGSRILCHCH